MQHDPITLIASRVESLEGRFADSITKIDGRLDQIVDLMTKVTQLQEREIKNAEQIGDLRTSMKELNQKVEDKIEKHIADIRVCKLSLDEKIDHLEDEVSSRIVDVSEKNAVTREEFQKWFNRGAGAWALASVLLIVLQGAGAYVINDIITKQTRTEDKIDNIETKLYNNEKVLRDIYSFAKEQHGLAPRDTAP